MTQADVKRINNPQKTSCKTSQYPLFLLELINSLDRFAVMQTGKVQNLTNSFLLFVIRNMEIYYEPQLLWNLSKNWCFYFDFLYFEIGIYCVCLCV